MLLLTGAFYYDTGAGSNTVGLYVYNGSSWVYSTNYNNVTAPYILAQDLNANGNDIISAGKIGIGTASPNYELTVAGGGINSIQILSSTTGTGAFNGLRLWNTGSSTAMWNYDNTPTLFGTNNTERLRIDSSGNVGIGTSSPSAKLDVELGTTGTIAEFRGGDSDILQIKNENDLIVFDTRNTASGLAFQMQGTERMRMDVSGNVGIGTTSPSAKLHIVGANASAPNLATSVTNAKVKIQNHNGSGLSSHQGYTGNSWYTQVANSNGTTAYDLSLNPYGGKVGIGTDSPATTLDVKSKYSFNSASNGAIRVQNFSNAAYGSFFNIAGTQLFDNSTYYGSGAFLANGAESSGIVLGDGTVSFKTNSGLTSNTAFTPTERMRIDSSGKVGIGTTSPDRPLDITDSTNDGTGGVVIHSYLPTLELDDISGGGTSFILQHDATNTLFKHGTTERMRIDSSGRVGIGTTSPSGSLVVSSSGEEGIEFFPNNFTNGNTIQHYDRLNSVYSIVKNIAADHRFNIGATEAMRINSDGNVGIGTDSPLHKVDITGNASTAYDATSDSGQSNHDATLQIFNRNTTDESFASLVFRNRNSNVGISRISSISTASATTDMSFVTEHSNTKSEKLRITSQGNVGIGTDSPACHLEVSGSGNGSVSDHLRITSTDTEAKLAFVTTTGNGAIYQNGYDLVFANNTANTERMRIDSSGNLLVGTTSTNATGGGFSFRAGNVHYMNIAHTSSVGHGNYFAAFKHNDTVVGTITKTNTTGVSYNTSSDERLKENITDSADAGSKVDAIQIRQYDWKADGSHQDYGVIAQELVEVAPEAVHQPIDPDDMMGVDYSKLVPMLIKEVQTLRNRVAQLENN